MDLRYLYKLASLLDSQGKYVESDVVYDSMLKIAAPDGRGKTQGRRAPRDNRNFRLSPQQVQQRLNPNAPGLVPVQNTPPVAPQTQAAPAAAASQLSPNQMVKFFIRQGADMKGIISYLNKIGYPMQEFAEAYDAELGKGKFQYDLDRLNAGQKSGPAIRMPKVVPKPTMMSIDTMRRLLEKANGNLKLVEDYLKTNPDLRNQFIAAYDQQNGRGAYENNLSRTPGGASWNAGNQEPSGQSSARPGRGTNTGTGAGASNNTGRGGTGSGSGGAGSRPGGGSGTAGNASAGGGPRPGGGSGTAGNASAGGGAPKPGGGSSYRGPEPKFDPIPKDFNPITAGANAAKYRLLILQNPGNRPGIAARLELLVKRGLLDPKTGNWTRNFSDLQMSELERFYSKLGRAQDGVSDAASAAGKAGRAGAGAGSSSFSPASFARTLNTTKVGQKLVTQLYAANKIFTNVVAKIPPPALKLISKIKFVFIFLNFARFIQALLNGTLEYKQTIEFIAACASIYPPVLATIGLIPIVGPGLVIAIGAVNLGAADVVEFFGNPEAGLNYMGIQITGPSMRRKTDQIDFSTVDVSTLDKSVQNALTESVPLIKNGLKIREILVDPGMVQRHPWLSKRDDIRFTQFSGALGVGGFYKQNKQQAPSGQQRLDNERKETNDRFAPSDQSIMPQNGANNQNTSTQAPAQVLRNYNDLLYKAYVDTVQSTNITLENLKNYRQQIITKINNLAPRYPNINAQQAITALDNRIRKYSEQANPA
jgi:hypothetical protein